MFGGPYNGMFAGQQGTPGFKALQILQGNASSGPPPNDPRLRWRPMMVEPWLDHVSTLNKDWHTFEQIPRVHPRAHLPHPLGTSSYPKIHMESLRDYSIRNNPPAPYEARMKVAVEDQMGWLRRYPKIPGDVLSDEQIANGCGKIPSKESGEPIKVCIVIRTLDDTPADWPAIIEELKQQLYPQLIQNGDNQPIETKVIHMDPAEDLPESQGDVDRLQSAYAEMADQHHLILLTGGPTVDPIFVTDFIKGRYTNDRAWLGKMTLIDLPTKKTSALDSSAVLKKLCNWAEEVPNISRENPIFIYFGHYFFEGALRRQMLDQMQSTPGYRLPDNYRETHRYIFLS